jgi:hypothetical protein
MRKAVTAFCLALLDGYRTFSDSWWARRHPTDFIALCILDRIGG